MNAGHCLPTLSIRTSFYNIYRVLYRQQHCAIPDANHFSGMRLLAAPHFRYLLFLPACVVLISQHHEGLRMLVTIANHG